MICVAVSCSSPSSRPPAQALSTTSQGSAPGGSATGGASPAQSAKASVVPGAFSDLDKVYRDETHCLTDADMRGDQDMRISCWCRDAVVDSRYVYATYLLPGKDPNLNGTFLALEQRVRDRCGATLNPLEVERGNWNWDGPEVVRTYPADDVVARIAPETRNGKATGRWIPFTVQLVYRDSQGRVSRTENYSSREFEPLVK